MGWITGEKCILGRFWAARGLRRGILAGKQEIFMKTGGDGGLILFSCVVGGFGVRAGVWRARRRPAEAKNSEKGLATGLGGLKTGVFSRKTGSLQENRNFSGKQEGGSLFLFGRLFSVSGFVVAGPGGAGAVSPMAGPTGASYKNPNPRQYPITNVQHPITNGRGRGRGGRRRGGRRRGGRRWWPIGCAGRFRGRCRVRAAARG